VRCKNRYVEQQCCATYYTPLLNVPNETKHVIKINLTLSVRLDKLSSWQFNGVTVFAYRYLVFSAEGIIQQ